MMSALITADCFWSGGYLAISRSILLSESVVSIQTPKTGTDHVFWRRGPSTSGKNVVCPCFCLVSKLALPIVDPARSRFRRMAPFAVVSDDLAGIGVLADFRVGHGADREVAQRLARVVDDLVRGLGPADRAADD